MAIKKIVYYLEIYEPGSARDVWAYFSSSSPFMSLKTGDILNPGTWKNSKSPMRVLKIKAVEHIIWDTAKVIKHKIMIFSDEVAGTEDLRRGK